MLLEYKKDGVDRWLEYEKGVVMWLEYEKGGVDRWLEYKKGGMYSSLP